MRYLILVLALLSCQKPSNKEQETKPVEKTKLERLVEKEGTYKKLQPHALDQYGWPVGCDGLGFLALCKTAGGCEKANFFDGEQEPGKWQRNKEHNCQETGKSKTSISKDMLMMSWVYGVFGMEKSVAIDYFSRIEAYGKSNDWIMGYPAETLEDLGRVYMTPTMTWTLYSILEKFGKKMPDHDGLKALPTGYQAHLRVLDVLIQGHLHGGIDAIQMADLNDLHDRDPNNALYQAAFHRYTDGDMSEVADILLDEKHFPKDALATNDNHCEPYLWQRDQGADWMPCSTKKTHDGIDWLFAYWLAGFK
jgi:hypothetical protein